MKPKKWREHSVRGKIKIVVFSLIPVFLLFVCAEVLATITIRRDIAIQQDSITGRGVYTMRIGGWPWSHKSVTPLNSMGFPDDEFGGVPSPDSCLHIVFSGDSFVFGDGVDRDSNFVEIVKRRSSEHERPCTRIFNIGERDATIEQEAARIRETLDILHPDIVILGQYENDLTDLSKPGYVASELPDSQGGVRPWLTVRQRLRVFSLNIVRFLSYHTFAFMIRNSVEYDALEKWSVFADPSKQHERDRLTAIYAEYYDSLATELAERDIAFGVVIIPSKFDVLARRFPEESYFVSLAERHRVPYLRLFPILDEDRSQYAYLMYDGHLSESGNRLVATAVHDWLFKTEPAPFPALRSGSPPDR